MVDENGVEWVFLLIENGGYEGWRTPVPTVFRTLDEAKAAMAVCRSSWSSDMRIFKLPFWPHIHADEFGQSEPLPKDPT